MAYVSTVNLFIYLYLRTWKYANLTNNSAMENFDYHVGVSLAAAESSNVLMGVRFYSFTLLALLFFHFLLLEIY